jgi:hypothetical protein
MQEPRPESASSPAERAPVRPPEGRAALIQWLDALPVLWLALVLIGYGLLAFQPFLFPFLPLQAEIPGLETAERAVGPLLASLAGAAIIRYFSLRNGRSPAGPHGADPAGAAPDGSGDKR